MILFCSFSFFPFPVFSFHKTFLYLLSSKALSMFTYILVTWFLFFNFSLLYGCATVWVAQTAPTLFLVIFYWISIVRHASGGSKDAVIFTCFRSALYYLQKRRYCTRKSRAVRERKMIVNGCKRAPFCSNWVQWSGPKAPVMCQINTHINTYILSLYLNVMNRIQGTSSLMTTKALHFSSIIKCKKFS